MFHTIDSLQE